MFRRKDTFKRKIKVDRKKEQVTETISRDMHVPGVGRVKETTTKTMTLEEAKQRMQAELEARQLEVMRLEAMRLEAMRRLEAQQNRQQALGDDYVVDVD